MIGVIKAEIFKFYFDLKRYLFNYICGFVTTAIFLIGIYWGIYYLFARRGEEIAFIGLLLWIFVSSGLSDLTNHLNEEKYLGTLERISIVKSSLLSILIARCFVNFLFTAIRIFLIATFLYIIFHPPLVFLFTSLKKFLIILLVGALIIISIYGFGFLIGSLALIFKRVGALVPILEYFILFFSGIIIPFEKMPLFIKFFSYILPMTWGIKVLYAFKNNNNDNFIIYLLILILYTLIVLITGYFLFSYTMRSVKKTGEFAFY
ncbi:MAG: ABC transporter permease [Nitrososphaerota archaeon]